MNSKPYSQEWFEDGQIDEVAFCENFLQRMPLKCINGIFFSYDGMLPDSEVEKEIYRMVKPVLTKGISKKVKQLLEVLKLEAYSEELPVQMDRIHVNNGTYFLNGDFTEKKEFCLKRLQRMPLKCINGIFFSYDGMLPDSEVEKEIYRMVKPVLTKGISKKVKQLLEVLKLEAYSEELPVQMDRIHVNNGTYFLNGDFTEKKEFCLKRLPVNYEMKETKPERWLKFLSELLEEDDIPIPKNFRCRWIASM